MEVTRDVILDLLPVYLMGEASPATRALVEDYLARDPELAARVRANDLGALEVAGAGLPAPLPELELRAFERTRRVIFWMRWLCALACVFTAASLSCHFSFDSRGRLTDAGFLLGNYPLALALCMAAAAGCWIAYFALRRTVRVVRR